MKYQHLLKLIRKELGTLLRYDERDNVQARFELKPGSPEFAAYYQKHPELEIRRNIEIRGRKETSFKFLYAPHR